MTIGALRQLSVGKGAQDVVLTQEPQVTFFKQKYKRHTNFAIESISCEYNSEFDFGNTVKVKVPKKGDLIAQCYIYFELPALSIPAGSTFIGWTNSVGHVLIEEIELRIGGILIDKRYGYQMELEDELGTPESKRYGQNKLVGRFETVAETETNATGVTYYHVPLTFSFSKTFASALPLVALQYHDIEFTIKLRPFSECITFDGVSGPTTIPEITDAKFFIEYIYLDDNERKLFAQSDHQYLIEQLQFTGKKSYLANATQAKIDIDFNHCVKELQWVFVEDTSEDNNDWFNFSRRSDGLSQMTKANILIDGVERFERRDELFFRLAQPYTRHTRVSKKFIYTYSFCKYPEKLQPSGTLNFSRLDHAELFAIMRSSNALTNIYLYGINYNILIFSKGMVNLLFSS